MALLQNFVILFFLNLIVPFSLAKYGDYCETPADVQGKCVPTKSCASALQLVRNIYKFGADRFINEISLLQQSKCESTDDNTLICCPLGDIQMNPFVYTHLKNLECGKSGPVRIAQAEVAGLFDLRWMALLKYNGKEPFACGGSLIDDRHVLTAAHCLFDFKNLPIAVRLGEYDLSHNERDCKRFGKHSKCLDPVQDIGIEKYIVHEDYVYEGLYNDIAILRLERPVKINTRSIRPICLPITSGLQSIVPEEFIVAGWGMTKYQNRTNVLLWSTVPKRSHDVCEETFGLVLAEEHICAGGRGSHCTCKGDSGGPLFYPNTYVDDVVRAIQYGVVSKGALDCSRRSYPAVYTNIAQYMQWITDHMIIDEGDYYSYTHEHTKPHHLPAAIPEPTTEASQLPAETPRMQIENSAYGLKTNNFIFLFLFISILMQSSPFS